MNTLYGDTKKEIEINLLCVNRQMFRNKIEALMVNKKLTIIEAIEEYCVEKNVDVEDIISLLDSNLKTKLEEYAHKYKLFKAEYRIKNQLPI